MNLDESGPSLLRVTYSATCSRMTGRKKVAWLEKLQQKEREHRSQTKKNKNRNKIKKKLFCQWKVTLAGGQIRP